MKVILIVAALILVIAGVFFWRAHQLPDKSGTFVGAPKVEVAELIQHPKDHLHKTIAVEGIVTDQCESMGCFFYFKVGQESLRVDLADIAMNAPRRNGHHARAEGQMVPFDDGYQLSATAIEFQ